MTRHYRFLAIVSLALGLSGVLAPTSAHALSCAPMEESNFMTCEKGACSPVFRAKQIRIGDACRRRLVIDAVPPSAVKPLVTLLQRRAGPEPSGVYQISLWHRWAPVKATEVESFLKNEATRIYVDRLTTDHSAISDLRDRWQSRANWELFWESVWHALDLGILTVLLWVLYRSVLRYVHAIRSFFLRTQPARELWKPLLIQLMLFILGYIFAAFNFFIALSFQIMILAPAVLLVWLFEAGMYLYPRSRLFVRARSPDNPVR